MSAALRESVFNKHGSGSHKANFADLLTQRVPDVNLLPTSQVVQAGVYSFGRGLFLRPVITGAETSYRTMTTIQDGDFVYSKLMAWEGAVAMARERVAGALATPEFRVPVFSPIPVA